MSGLKRAGSKKEKDIDKSVCSERHQPKRARTIHHHISRQFCKAPVLQISIPLGRTGYGIAIRAISRLMANAVSFLQRKHPYVTTS